MTFQKLGMEETDYAAREATFEAKAGDDSRTCLWGGGVIVTGRGCIRGDQRAGSGYADHAEHLTGSTSHYR
jgi:hypothetical protein